MSSITSSRVLVTGASGYIGSHVVDQLLKASYNVRGIVRTGKTSKFLDMFPSYDSQRLDVIEIGDVSDGDFTEALKGVGAVIHVAAVSSAVVNGTATSEDIINAAVDGTLNVVNQAIKAGVRKVVVTSSIATLIGADMKRGYEPEPLTEYSWNPVTEEQLSKDGHLFSVYLNSKTIAERKFWELSDKHPVVDFTAILPPSVYGDFLPGSPAPEKAEGLGSPYFIYQLIGRGADKQGTWPLNPFGQAAHVRDVALAHVLALKADPLKDGRKKRLLISAGAYTWTEAVEAIRKARPELADRLLTEGVPNSLTIAPMDTSLTKEMLGLSEYIPWQKAIVDSIDSGLRWEKTGSL